MGESICQRDVVYFVSPKLKCPFSAKLKCPPLEDEKMETFLSMSTKELCGVGISIPLMLAPLFLIRNKKER
jgi:hypothetical protein